MSDLENNPISYMKSWLFEDLDGNVLDDLRLNADHCVSNAKNGVLIEFDDLPGRKFYVPIVEI